MTITSNSTTRVYSTGEKLTICKVSEKISDGLGKFYFVERFEAYLLDKFGVCTRVFRGYSRPSFAKLAARFVWANPNEYTTE